VNAKKDIYGNLVRPGKYLLIQGPAINTVRVFDDEGDLMHQLEFDGRPAASVGPRRLFREAHYAPLPAEKDVQMIEKVPGLTFWPKLPESCGFGGGIEHQGWTLVRMHACAGVACHPMDEEQDKDRLHEYPLEFFCYRTADLCSLGCMEDWDLWANDYLRAVGQQ
jgi:hypothetical protein